MTHASSDARGYVNARELHEQKHLAHVSQEATVLGRDSVRAVCRCGWYGTPFLPGEEQEAWRDGRQHEREERAR